MDELAYAVGVDPVVLRMRNHGPVDDRGHRWSSDGLSECLTLAAQRFGWGRRDPTPRARRDGDWLIGTGMAAAAYPIAFFMPEQRARARLHADGSAVVQMAAVEFGTGSLTMTTQVAADALGIAVGDVVFEAGDSNLPNATATVGSAGSGMIGSAVHAAGRALRSQLVGIAVADPGSPLHGSDPSTVIVASVVLTAASGAQDRYADVLARRRGGDGELAPAGVRRAVRAADLRRPVRRGRRRPRARARAGAPARGRDRPRAEPAARAQPADGRDALGHGPGVARRQPHGRPHRPLGGEQPGRVPGGGRRGRAGR